MINTAWHTLDLVCDDSFGTLEAKSACYTLGYTNGFSSFESSYDMTEWSEPEIPFLMDNVECGSTSTNFLSCSSSAEDCSHTENVLLKCYTSGKKSFTFKPWPFPGFAFCRVKIADQLANWDHVLFSLFGFTNRCGKQCFHSSSGSIHRHWSVSNRWVKWKRRYIDG